MISRSLILRFSLSRNVLFPRVNLFHKQYHSRFSNAPKYRLSCPGPWNICKQQLSRNAPFSTDSSKQFRQLTDQDVIFRQLLDYRSYTYSYILADASSKEGVLIDPVLDNVNRDLQIIKDLGINLTIVVNTHVHADHITGSGLLKQSLPNCKSYTSVQSGAVADRKFDHGSHLTFGKYALECRSTPGHTNGCYSFVWHENSMVFTGDAVLIRGCGRTDFQQGCSETLYESVHREIFSLPGHYRIYPAHDYTGNTVSTIDEEKQLNPRLRRTKEEFLEIMANLKLPYPNQIDKALPANLLCGLQPDLP
ncbi:Hypothetical predicted protein [Octopus vulgaris]|uniref:Persulfide dioxygenase ETHE1, mitochondrial n=1 Tax=Octopus vulgaris TaxID=6645 RepID=A0AA36AV45_OCTVU|nr:Hypothetical predicted protein [Octopus vulgaris]